MSPVALARLRIDLREYLAWFTLPHVMLFVAVPAVLLWYYWPGRARPARLSRPAGWLLRAWLALVLATLAFNLLQTAWERYG